MSQLPPSGPPRPDDTPSPSPEPGPSQPPAGGEPVEQQPPPGQALPPPTPAGEPQAWAQPPAGQPASGPPPHTPPRGQQAPPGGYRPPPGAQPAAGPAQPVRPRRSGGGLTCLIVAIIVIAVGLGFFAMMMVVMRQAPGGVATTWAGTTGDAVGVVKITGLITTVSETSLLLGATAGSENITSQLRKAEKDSSVKALVIRINSPGGSAVASQEIYQAVQEYRERTKRPVIASMGDVAASGGYYVAAAADRIIASPATLTGSIGVIMETIEYHGLMDKLGVAGNTMTSGKYKDMGSPLRDMKPDERQLFQAMINDIYDQFVEDVAQGRGMEKPEVKRLADGRAYTGRQAQKVGLVDELGTFRDAIRAAAKEAGITGEPTVKVFGRITLLDALLGDISSARTPGYFPPGLLVEPRFWPAPQILGGEPATIEAR